VTKVDGTVRSRAMALAGVLPAGAGVHILSGAAENGAGAEVTASMRRQPLGHGRANCYCERKWHKDEQ